MPKPDKDGNSWEMKFIALTGKTLKEFETEEDCESHFNERHAPPELVRMICEVSTCSKWRDLRSPSVIGFKLEIVREVNDQNVTENLWFLADSQADFGAYAMLSQNTINL
jgi:hypothetical protein